MGLLIFLCVGTVGGAALLATANWMLTKVHLRWVSNARWHSYFVRFLPIAAMYSLSAYFFVPWFIEIPAMFALYKLMFHRVSWWDAFLLGTVAWLLLFLLFLGLAFTMAYFEISEIVAT